MQEDKNIIRETNKTLKELREAKGLTQEKVAQIIGVTNISVSKWEVSPTMPKAAHIMRLSELYGADPEAIMQAKSNTLEAIKNQKEL